MAQLNNIRTVSIPSIGKLPLSDKGSSFTPSGVQRAHKAGRLAADGGFTSNETPAKLDLSLNLQPGLDIAALNSVENEDVTIRLADGQVHMMSMAYVTEQVSISDGESKLTLMSNTSERIS